LLEILLFDFVIPGRRAAASLESISTARLQLAAIAENQESARLLVSVLRERPKGQARLRLWIPGLRASHVSGNDDTRNCGSC